MTYHLILARTSSHNLKALLCKDLGCVSAHPWATSGFNLTVTVTVTVNVTLKLLLYPQGIESEITHSLVCSSDQPVEKLSYDLISITILRLICLVKSLIKKPFPINLLLRQAVVPCHGFLLFFGSTRIHALMKCEQFILHYDGLFKFYKSQIIHTQAYLI